MPVTVIYGERSSSVAGAAVEGDNLWLSLDALRTATGWELEEVGKASGPKFWTAGEALGEQPYYPQVELRSMPSSG